MKTCLTLTLLAFYVCFYTAAATAQTKAKTTTAAKPKTVAPAAAPQPTSANTNQPADNVAADAEPGKDRVAIYPFTTARGYDYDFAQSVGNAIEAGFVKSNRFTVVERSRFGQLKAEDRFQEVNTSEVVQAASRLGAKFIVTGHITGVSTGETHDYQGKFTGYLTSISVAFKIIEVVTSQIKVTESINLSGSGGSTATSIGSAYASIDAVTRRIIASYFPQRFLFMAIGTKEEIKKGTMLTSFKIWGGSDNGLKAGDMVEVYTLSEIVNPATHKSITEKQFVGAAQITAINSGSTATCGVWKPRKYGMAMLDVMTNIPDKVAIEYTGGARPASFWDGL